MKKHLLFVFMALLATVSAKAELVYHDNYDYYDEASGLYLCRQDRWSYDYSNMLVCSRGTVYDSKTSHNSIIASYSGNVVIPEYVMNGEVKINIVGIESGAFSGCVDLKSVTIGKGVKNIVGGAFSGCTSLTSITIPETVESIGPSTFEGCTSLTEVSIPDNVDMNDNNGMFDGCTNLKKVKLPKGITYLGIYFLRNCPNIETFVVPESVESMGSSIFEGCTSLKSLKLPANLKAIPRDMCYECKALTSVEMGNKITFVGMGAFMRCESLESLILPNTVEEMEIAVVRECPKLKDFPIPSSLKAIPAFMFSDCVSLPETMVIPGNVKKVGSAAFQACTSIKTMILEDGVEEIDYNAFHNCSNMTYAVLPPSMKVVHCDAFQQLLPEDLAIVCHAVTPPDTKGIFQGSGNFRVYVPAGSVDAYKASSWWQVVNYSWGTFTNVKGIYPMTDEMAGIEGVSYVENKNNATYSLGGHRVTAPQKGGIYIKNGKKIMF